ncbi:MAG: glycosyltransferase [Nanoarchaeota archaeon]|nr:glycosyltransferase [Nanoarchaeota archaeon]
MSKLFISYVLPAYNEEENVLLLMDKITSAMKDIKEEYEIIFVIEGTDQTYPLLLKYKEEHPEVSMRLFYQPEPLGLTYAFKKGFENIAEEATHVVTMDVDLNHKPEELPLLIKKAKEGYNVVIGSRALDGAQVMNVPAWKIMISKFANTVFNKAFNIEVKDKTSGFRMIDAETIKEVAPLVQAKNFEGLMEFLLIANYQNKSMAEVPITLIHRQFGETKFHLFKTGIDYARLLLKQKYRKRKKKITK